MRIIYRPSDISVTLYFCQTALHFHSPLSGFTSRKSSHQPPDSTAWSPSNLLLPSPLRSSIMFMGKIVKKNEDSVSSAAQCKYTCSPCPVHHVLTCSVSLKSSRSHHQFQICEIWVHCSCRIADMKTVQHTS